MLEHGNCWLFCLLTIYGFVGVWAKNGTTYSIQQIKHTSELALGESTHCTEQDCSTSRNRFRSFENSTKSTEEPHSFVKRAIGKSPLSSRTTRSLSNTRSSKVGLVVSSLDVVMLTDSTFQTTRKIFTADHGLTIEDVAVDGERWLVFLSLSNSKILALTGAEFRTVQSLTPDPPVKGRLFNLCWNWLHSALYVVVHDAGEWKVLGIDVGWSVTGAIEVIHVPQQRQRRSLLSLPSRPSHMDVDPVHGYLYMTFSAQHESDSSRGLYRADLPAMNKLTAISQSRQSSFATFAIDYASSAILLPGSPTNNAVMAVKFSGDVIDNLRAKAVKPVYGSMHQLASHSGVLFWIDRSYVYRDICDTATGKYYTTAINFTLGASLLTIHVLSDWQHRTKIQIDPPTNVQVLFGSTEAIVSWSLPGNPALAATTWQHQVTVHNGDQLVATQQSNKQSVTIENLQPSTEYKFMVNRQSWFAKSAGASQVTGSTFSARIADTSLLFATRNTVNQCSVTGARTKQLVRIEKDQFKLGLRDIKDLSIPFNETLLLVTAGEYLQVLNTISESVHSLTDAEQRRISASAVAFDPLSHKLVWYDSFSSSIMSKYGDEKATEILVANTTVRTRLVLDPARGTLYWGTYSKIFAVYLSGQYQTEIFKCSKCSVYGLAIDYDQQQIYWLVSSESAFQLYSRAILSQLPPARELLDHSMLAQRHLLTNFSPTGPFAVLENRFFFAVKTTGLVVYDLNTNTTSVMNLTGVSTKVSAITIMDPKRAEKQDTMPVGQYIARQVFSDSIELSAESNGSTSAEPKSRVWKVTWQAAAASSVIDVHYIVIVDNGRRYVTRTSSLLFRAAYPPDWPVSIRVTSCTRWHVSTATEVTRKTPQNRPQPPTNIRYFSVSYASNQWTSSVRWSQSAVARQNVLLYRVLLLQAGRTRVFVNRTVLAKNNSKCDGEFTFDHTQERNTYTLRVSAVNSAGAGMAAEHIVTVPATRPPPLALLSVATESRDRGHLLLVDLDSGRQTVINVSAPVIDSAVDRRGHQVFLLTADSRLLLLNLLSLSTSLVHKLESKSSTLAYDWVGGELYWFQQSSADTGHHHLYKMAVVEELERRMPVLVFSEKVPAIPRHLTIAPLTSKIFWSEETIEGIRVYSVSLRAAKLHPEPILSYSMSPGCSCPVTSVISAVSATGTSLPPPPPAGSSGLMSRDHSTFSSRRPPAGGSDNSRCPCHHRLLQHFSEKDSLVALADKSIYWISPVSHHPPVVLFSRHFSTNVSEVLPLLSSVMAVYNIWPVDGSLQPSPPVICVPAALADATVSLLKPHSATFRISLKSTHPSAVCDSFPANALFRCQLYFAPVANRECASNLSACNSAVFYSPAAVSLANLTPATRYRVHLRLYSALTSPTLSGRWTRNLTFVTPAQPDLKLTTPTVDRLHSSVLWQSVVAVPGSLTVYRLQTREQGAHTDWRLVYQGADTNWTMDNVLNFGRFSFRVAAGYDSHWGGYSPPSRFYAVSHSVAVTEPAHTATFNVSVSVVVVTLLLLVVVLAAILYFRKSHKKAFILNEKPLSVCYAAGSASTRAATTTATSSSSSALPPPALTLSQLPAIPASLHVQGVNSHYRSICSTPATASTTATATASRSDCVDTGKLQLLQQLQQLPAHCVSLDKFLGSGAFGKVYEGRACLAGSDSKRVEWRRVAVKTLTESASASERSAFVKEAWLMSNFSHAHVLSSLGVCWSTSQPLCLVLELMECGDLLSFLRAHRTPVDDGFGCLSLSDQIQTVLDVAGGCAYLERQHYVHRDLAARNCLVTRAGLPSPAPPATPLTGGATAGGGGAGRGRRLLVKVGDFGLARDIYDSDYYKKEGEGLLPIRWMSPEALLDGVFSSGSDVWAFGVLAWEVMSAGQQPYPGRTNIEVLRLVTAGVTPQPPAAAQDCPPQLTELMRRCWRFRAEARPTFAECVGWLSRLQTLVDASTSNTVHNAQYTAAGGAAGGVTAAADGGAAAAAAGGAAAGGCGGAATENSATTAAVAAASGDVEKDGADRLGSQLLLTANTTSTTTSSGDHNHDSTPHAATQNDAALTEQECRVTLTQPPPTTPPPAALQAAAAIAAAECEMRQYERPCSAVLPVYSNLRSRDELQQQQQQQQHQQQQERRQRWSLSRERPALTRGRMSGDLEEVHFTFS